MYSLDNEVWKEMTSIGYPDYEISNMGRVKSNRRSKSRLLSLFVNNRDYVSVKLVKLNGKNSPTRVHPLVAQMFLGHKPDGGKNELVCHKNHIKTDNRADNLYIGSTYDNCTDYRHLVKTKSKYLGVSGSVVNGRWQWYSRAKIYIDGKCHNLSLGYFEEKQEELAAESYKSTRSFIDAGCSDLEVFAYLREHYKKLKKTY